MAEATHRVIPNAAKNPRDAVIDPDEFHAALRMTVPRLASLPARAAGALVWLYQRTVSPALAAVNPSCGCRFAPTCSAYAREALRTHGLFAGLILTGRRLVKCGPWHPGGLDPVPPHRLPVCVRLNTLSPPPARPRTSPTIIHG